MALHLPVFDINGFEGKLGLPDTLTSITGDTFRLVRFVKAGGNGAVFEARQGPELANRPCAVKFLKRLDEQRRDRFSNEVRILSALSHVNVSGYYGHGEIALAGRLRVPWVAMDLGGPNLRQDVHENGPLQGDVLRETARQMCAAVLHLHGAGIIHRDIKPDNFVWLYQRRAITMIDFGIAKYHDEDLSGRPLDHFTKSLEFVGPAHYSSAELLQYAVDKATAVDQRSDIFQLAKCIWFAATQRVSAGIPSKRLCPLAGRLWSAILTSFSDDPADRPGSAEDLCDRISSAFVRNA
jgi:eukaryotic-like serine/threonine-protein kinase